jgi:hypothetical protein
MILRKRLDPKVLIRTGLVFLIIASLWRWFGERATDFSSGIVDGSTGLFYGISIGCLTFGLWLQHRGGTAPRDRRA